MRPAAPLRLLVRLIRILAGLPVYLRISLIATFLAALEVAANQLVSPVPTQLCSLNLFDVSKLAAVELMTTLTLFQCVVCVRFLLSCSAMAVSARFRATVIHLTAAFTAATATSVLAIYVLSWNFYARVGSFLDLQTCQFALANQQMVFHHVAATHLAKFVLLLFVLSACFGVLYAVSLTFFRGFADSSRQLAAFGAGSAAIFLLLLVDDYYVVSEIASGLQHQAEDDVVLQASQRTTPVAHILAYRLNPFVTLAVDSLSVREPQPCGILSSGQLGEPRRRARVTLGAKPPSPDSLSVVLVTVESLRQDVILLSENSRPVMPNVSRLARNGAYFTRAYAQSTHSNYADPCIYSSLYPLRTARYHYYSRSDPWPKTLLYDVLHQCGYRNGLFSSQNESWGNMDEFLRSDSLDVFFDSQSYDGPTYSNTADPGFARYVAETQVAGKIDDSVTIDAAMNWITRQANDGMRFCACVNLQSPHFPYHVPAGAAHPFEPSEMSEQASFLSYPAEDIPAVRNAYLNAMHYVDSQVGRLVTRLHELGIEQRTLIVIVGDNGESFYEEGFPTHGGPPVESQINVGLVMRCPAAIKPVVVDYLTEVVDIAPTILGLLGLQPPPAAQGVDVFSPTRPASDERVAFTHCGNGRTLCDGIVSSLGWKYIIDYRQGTERLTNHIRDPSESEDFSASHAGVARELRGLLIEWRRRQLLYYANACYYAYWYPPPAPRLSQEAVVTLRAAGAD